MRPGEIDVLKSVQFSSLQSLSCVQFFVTPWIAARQASLSINNSWSSLKLTSIESVMPSSHLILCRPLLLLPPIPPSIRVFSNESTLHMRWPKYWTFSFSISPSKEHPGLMSFRMDWLDLLAVQGTLKSLLQHHSSKASILRAWSQNGSSHPRQGHAGEPWRARGVRARGAPWTCLSVYPKTRICFTILWLLPTPLTFTGGYPRPPFSVRKST